MIRRLKNDVLHELPAKRRQKIEVQVDSKLLKEIEKLLRDVPLDNQSTLESFGLRSFEEALDDLEQQQ